MAVDGQIAALLTAGSTLLGGFVMWAGQRRNGKLTMTGHQLKYIDDQQQDIRDLQKDNERLRADFLDLWDWTLKVTQLAAQQHVSLPPLPRQRPRSESSTADERREHSA